MDWRREAAEKQDGADISERLKRHPILEARVRGLLDLGENVSGAQKADDAEREAVHALRRFGQEILSEWARHRAQQADEAAMTPERIKHSKKKSAGAARSEKSR